MVVVTQVACVPEYTLLEGPHWDIPTQSLYFVDIMEGLIFRYDYKADVVHKASVEGEKNCKIGFIVPVEGVRNRFVIGCGPKLLLIEWDGKSETAKRIKVLAEVDQDVKLTRINDGKCDPRGRIFTGTILSEENGDVFKSRIGSMYRFVPSTSQAICLRKNICISNGLAWNEALKKFYYIDTVDREISEYDYNPETGEISNMRVLIDFKPNMFWPDGMTIDADGNLFVATFGNSKVLKIGVATKKVEQEILIPNCKQVTSVAFGGPNLDELFVTTARLNQDPPPAGGLFKVTGLGVKGLKMINAKLN